MKEKNLPREAHEKSKKFDKTYGRPWSDKFEVLKQGGERAKEMIKTWKDVTDHAFEHVFKPANVPSHLDYNGLKLALEGCEHPKVFEKIRENDNALRFFVYAKVSLVDSLLNPDELTDPDSEESYTDIYEDIERVAKEIGMTPQQFLIRSRSTRRT
jgi:hypothetical protein